MRRSILLGRIRGIPVEIRLSTIVLLVMFTILMAFARFEIGGLPVGYGHLSTTPVVKLALGATSAVIILIGILIHELAHCLVARRMGHTVQGITIFILGGEMNLDTDRRYETVRGEEIIAFVGPATTLVLGGVFLSLSILFSDADPSSSGELLVTCLSVLGFYHLILGAFNLLPGFPFDGGLILRSFLSKRMDQEQTTLAAVKVCRMCAMGMGMIGFLIGDLSIILIGILLYLTAYIEDPQFSYKVE